MFRTARGQIGGSIGTRPRLSRLKQLGDGVPRWGGRELGRRLGPMGTARTKQSTPNGRVGLAGGQDGSGQRIGRGGRWSRIDQTNKRRCGRRGGLQHLTNLDDAVRYRRGQEHSGLQLGWKLWDRILVPRRGSAWGSCRDTSRGGRAEAIRAVAAARTDRRLAWSERVIFEQQNL
jgi:hypothetical protein